MFDEDAVPAVRPSSQGWMLIFADLLSLMLTFFVLIFSMNAVQVEDWEAVVTSLSDRLNPRHSTHRTTEFTDHERASILRLEANNLDYLATYLSEALANDPVLNEARVRELGDRVAISIPTDRLFKGTNIRITDTEVFQALAGLSTILRNVENEVTVIAYNDPAPVTSTAYDTHWELSMSRAVVVARALQQSGYRKPVMAYAHGEGRFGGNLDDLPEAIRERLARRVDIVIREHRTGQ